MLISYIRDENRRKVGVVIAEIFIDDPLKQDRLGIGWSICSNKDNFNKHRGIEIAYGRAHKGKLLGDIIRYGYKISSSETDKFPTKFKEQLLSIIYRTYNRARIYYKQMESPQW
jgi:hypothetical protein